MLERFKINSKT